MATAVFCSTSQKIGTVLGIALFIGLLNFELDDDPEGEFATANEMAAVVALIACFWMFEVIPLEATALFPMVLLPALNVMPSTLAAKGYMSSIIMMFLGAFVVDAAIIHVNLHTRLALYILNRVDLQQPWKLIAVFMGLALVMSSSCSNTATTVMLVPLAGSILDTTKKFMNQHKVDEAGGDGGNAAGREPLANGVEQFETQPISKQDEAMDRFGTGVMLSICYGATCGGITTLLGTPPNGILAGNELLTGYINYADFLLFGLPIGIVLAFVVFVVLVFKFARGVNIQIDPEDLRQLYDDLGPMNRDEKAVAVVQLLQIAGFLIRGFGFLPFHNGENFGYLNDGSVACAAAVLPFMIPSVKRQGEAIMKWPDAQSHVPWGVLFLLGSGLCIAEGFKASNLTKLIGEQLGSTVASVSPLTFNFLQVTVVTFLTEITSNTASCSIMMPILAAVAYDTLTHPLLLMAPAAAACSFAFMTPVATAPNAIVFGTGRVKFRDFLQTGFLINIGSILFGGTVAFFMADVVYGAFGPFPEWACARGPAECTWLNETGVACEIVNATVCRLKDGTIVSYGS